MRLALRTCRSNTAPCRGSEAVHALFRPAWHAIVAVQQQQALQAVDAARGTVGVALPVCLVHAFEHVRVEAGEHAVFLPGRRTEWDDQGGRVRGLYLRQGILSLWRSSAGREQKA